MYLLNKFFFYYLTRKSYILLLRNIEFIKKMLFNYTDTSFENVIYNKIVKEKINNWR